MKIKVKSNYAPILDRGDHQEVTASCEYGYCHSSFFKFRTASQFLMLADSISGDEEAIAVSLVNRLKVGRVVIIEQLHVNLQQRGQKIGSELISALMNWSKEKRADIVLLTSEPEDETKREDLDRFYTRLGFSNQDRENPRIFEKHLNKLHGVTRSERVTTLDAYTGKFE